MAQEPLVGGVPLAPLIPSVADFLKAVELNDRNKVARLLEAGVFIDAKDDEGDSALHYAVFYRMKCLLF